MSDYGFNFGFRNTLEDAAVREGRWKIPATAEGRKIRQGDLVTHDSANPGFVKLAPTGAKPEVGVTGLCIQSSGWYPDIHSVGVVDSHGREKTKPGLTAVHSGAGIKIWVKNTAKKSFPDGREIPAQDRLSGAVAVGNFVSWDATTQTFVGAAEDTNAVGKIVLASADGKSAEIVLF